MKVSKAVWKEIEKKMHLVPEAYRDKQIQYRPIIDIYDEINLQDILKKLPHNDYSKYKFSLSAYSDSYEASLMIESLENDEEYVKRIQGIISYQERINVEASKKESKERAEYERLKKKYGS